MTIKLRILDFLYIYALPCREIEIRTFLCGHIKSLCLTQRVCPGLHGEVLPLITIEYLSGQTSSFQEILVSLNPG